MADVAFDPEIDAANFPLPPSNRVKKHKLPSAYPPPPGYPHQGYARPPPPHDYPPSIYPPGYQPQQQRQQVHPRHPHKLPHPPLRQFIGAGPQTLHKQYIANKQELNGLSHGHSPLPPPGHVPTKEDMSLFVLTPEVRMELLLMLNFLSNLFILFRAPRCRS